MKRINFYADNLHIEPTRTDAGRLCHRVEADVWPEDLIASLIDADISVDDITEMAKKRKIEIDSIFACPTHEDPF